MIGDVVMCAFPGCAQTFEPHPLAPHQKYCSPEHRKKAWKMRQARRLIREGVKVGVEAGMERVEELLAEEFPA